MHCGTKFPFAYMDKPLNDYQIGIFVMGFLFYEKTSDG